MSTPNEQAALLAEQAASALAAARRSLGLAADVTDEVDKVLKRSENGIDELPDHARLMRETNNPQWSLLNANRAAEVIEQRLRVGQSGIADVRDHLDQGARALDAGRQFLTELEQLPGQQGKELDRLRFRLDGLGRAVRDAGEGVDEAGKRIAAARRNIEPLIYPPNHIDDRHRTAAMIGNTGANVQNDVMAVRSRLAGLREDFDLTQPNATVAAWQSAELATAARAAMNPTPASAQRSSAGSSEIDPWRRNEGPQGPNVER
jgi:hypothetical protein